METKTLTQTVRYENVNPETLFEIFMNEEKHSQIVGGAVTMPREVGENFSVFDGYCTGTNIEIVPHSKIVQDWNFKEEGWPEAYYTRCTFTFEATKEGTLVTFVQKDIPAHKAQSLADGWAEFYWYPIRKHLQSESM